MTRATRFLSCGAMLTAMVAGGCDNGGKSSGEDGDTDGTTKAEATASASGATKAATNKPAASQTAKAKAAPKNVAIEFFTGESPSEVKLTKGYVEDYTSFEYAIKTPAEWKGGGQPSWGYMAMRKDSTAALFCDIMGNDESLSLGSLVSFKEIANLAKRAPIMGKNLKEDGPPVAAKVGKLGYPARVGHATGNLFKEDGSQLFWIDVRHKQPEGPWHMYCLVAIKKGAADEVMTEAKAIMRSLEAPRGKEVLEPKMD